MMTGRVGGRRPHRGSDVGGNVEGCGGGKRGSREGGTERIKVAPVHPLRVRKF